MVSISMTGWVAPSLKVIMKRKASKTQSTPAPKPKKTRVYKKKAKAQTPPPIVHFS